MHASLGRVLLALRTTEAESFLHFYHSYFRLHVEILHWYKYHPSPKACGSGIQFAEGAYMTEKGRNPMKKLRN